MATTTTPWRRTPSAGGKIVKKRNFERTPYTRPSNSNDPPENPNWISTILKPAQLIASGATKFVSFFGNDDDSTSSSETDDDDELENDMSFQEDDRLDTVLSPSSKSDNKCAIEQLVMQETYSRKEANELIKLIRSRTLDTSGSIVEATPNVRTTAIMEARKWLEEKRSAFNRKLESELDVSNMASPSQISRNEKGSPVDIARSYMQSRPAWASSKVFEAGSSSPFGVLHFNEETPKSTLRTSELNKSSFNSGSWNILDEIRRVRSRATQEILAASPLTKTNMSPFSTQSNQPQDTITSKTLAVGPGLVDSTHARSENVMQDVEACAPLSVSQDNDAGKAVELEDSEEAHVLKYDNKDEVKQLKSATTENGFDCSEAGLVKGEDTTHEAQPRDEEIVNLADSSQEQTTDIPTDTAINGSENNSSMHEEVSQDFSDPHWAPHAKAKDRQKERKTRGRTRRGRGRGK